MSSKDLFWRIVYDINFSTNKSDEKRAKFLLRSLQIALNWNISNDVKVAKCEAAAGNSNAKRDGTKKSGKILLLSAGHVLLWRFHASWMITEKKEKVKKNLVGLVKHDVFVIYNEFYNLIRKYCCVRRNDFRELTSAEG